MELASFRLKLEHVQFAFRAGLGVDEYSEALVLDARLREVIGDCGKMNAAQAAFVFSGLLREILGLVGGGSFGGRVQ